jgi:hypothetical protein
MKLTIVALFGLLAVASAWCPNGCSGHGSCQTGAANKDVCNCYERREARNVGYGAGNGMVKAWQGADCSERTCPSGRAWAASPQANNDHEQVIECSGRGICDRKTGVCGCFAGHWGEGCRRSTCPNQCSGHGICQDLKHFAEDSGAIYKTSWDSFYNYGCLCDQGFRGPDCSMMECPSDVDVMNGEGSDMGRDCSGRGLCDYATGTCTCFSGFFGTKCESQTVLN